MKKISNKFLLGATIFSTLVFSFNAYSQSADNDSVNQLKSFFGKLLTNQVTANTDENELPDWFNRVEIDSDFSANGRPIYGVSTIQPLFSDGTDVFFNQSRVAYRGDGRTTGNFGFGYRKLTLDEQVIVGVNTFYDYQFPYGHQRASYGAELRSSAFEINANYYDGLSGWRDAETIYEERAMGGYDVEFGMQVPYVPWAWAFAKSYYYDGKAGDDLEGQRYSLRLRPLPFLEFEAGHDMNDESNDNNYAQARLRFGFNEPEKVAEVRKSGWVSSRPFEYGEKMNDQMLERVRRSNDITVEKRVKSSAGGSGGRASVVLARSS